MKHKKNLNNIIEITLIWVEDDLLILRVKNNNTIRGTEFIMKFCILSDDNYFKIKK